MSIGVIVVMGPRRTKSGTCGTNSGAELDVSYLVLCPLKHIVGRREHVLDPFLTDRGMGTLKRETDFQCPECGIRFGLTDDDVRNLENSITGRCGA